MNIEKIKNHPDYHKLVSGRSKFAWTLAVIMLVVYYSFILLIAFSPKTLGTPLVEGGVTTLGIPVGIAVIIFSFILTGIYVKRANIEFDELTHKLRKEVENK